MKIKIKLRVIGKTQGFYEVIDENKEIYTVKLKGILKKNNDKLNCVIGDIVDIDIDDLVITNIHNRENLLLRPLVSNIDYVGVVSSIVEPNFDIINFCKNLLWVDKQNIKTILILNKIDLVSENELFKFIDELKEKVSHIKIFPISLKENKGVNELKEFLKDKTIVLSGASGVGKSSLVNFIIEDDYLEVGDISKKTKKGKNTTIITKYFEKNNIKIFDTPGYNNVSIPNYTDKKEIMTWFVDFRKYLGLCKFRDCIHLKEPNCSIKENVKNGNINSFRYEFYTKILEEE